MHLNIKSRASRWVSHSFIAAVALGSSLNSINSLIKSKNPSLLRFEAYPGERGLFCNKINYAASTPCISRLQKLSV